MYAIFEDGSRQYRVSEGDTLRVDYREAPAGSRIEFQKVLLFADGTDVKIGQPAVEGMRVLAEVLKETSTKVYVQHFRRRKNYRRLRGHRQPYLQILVKNILMPGQPTPPVETPAPQPAPAVDNSVTPPTTN
jgi:large subunit ribosomal protein L21